MKISGFKKKPMANSYGKIFKRGDLILLILLLVVIVLTIVFSVRKGADYVEIYLDGSLVYQLDINTNQEVQLLDGDVTVVVRNKKAWVEKSDCVEQLCVHSSPIGKDGGMIVCLPNRVVVKIATKEVAAIT